VVNGVRVPLVRYITYYVILIVVTALLILLTPVGFYILFILSIPIAASLAITLANEVRASKGRPWFMGRQVNDAAYIVLTLLMALGAFLITPIYDARIALASLLLLASAVMINRLGSSYSLTNVNVGEFLRKMAVAVALFSLASLFGLAYSHSHTPLQFQP
jgi:hypothetical protein